MASLHMLPTELLCKIFECLDSENTPQEGQNPDATGLYRTFASLARACRRFSPIARQFLYRRYDGKLFQAHPGFLRQVSLDPVLPQFVKHIRADCITQRGERYAGRSVRELGPAAKRLLGHHDYDFNALLWKMPLELEMAVLVASAANIETIEIRTNYRKYMDQKCCPWLFPILEAAQVIPEHIQNEYGRLHTLRIGMWMPFSKDFGYLFNLPALRRLYLDRLVDSPVQDDELSKWPIQGGTSRIHTLKFYQPETSTEPLVQMMLSCKALREFGCSRSVGTFESQRLFFTALMSALEPHADSLKSLWLRASAKPMKQLHYHRIEGFHRFHTLKSLRLPFTLLMGEPSRTLVNDSWQPDTHWAGYPQMRNILPPRVNKLTIDMCDDNLPIEGCEDVLTSAYPIDINDNQHFQSIHLVYDAMKWNNPLPMNFWVIMDSYRAKGIQFDYCILNGLKDAWLVLDNTPKHIQIDGLAKELAKYGPRGVDMADHLELSPTLVKAKVLELLDLNPN